MATKKDFTDALQPAGPSGPSVLQNERRGRDDVEVDRLARHLLSRDNFLERQSRILEILTGHEIFAKHNQLHLARADRFHLALARAKMLRRLSLEHGWTLKDYEMAGYLVDEMSPFFLQSSMFVTTVREQGDEAQKRYWVPKIEKWEIIGCYGQTEMGHGSNVRGIETEARWDPTTKEFVMHSPTLTASKWWNGALGRTANHAIVVAQLMLPVPGKDGEYKAHGPHQFIMQIRDMKTHQPLPGIVVGDIGPKYGYTSMDNGYMLFDQHRIPHAALLSRYSGVDSETGAYMKPENPATVYGSLTYVRANYIASARLALARATTIAIRYTAIRRQFADRDAKTDTTSSSKPAEEAVLNYPTVQIRLLPLLATVFALHYTGEAMLKLYWSTRQSIEKTNDFSRLAEMHAQSSGLKSLCTMLAADGIETCRRALGGHGFGGGSGLIPLNNDYLSKPTVEGDNWMITQQTASYLIKRMERAAKSPSSNPTDEVDVLYRDYLRKREGPQSSSSSYNLVIDPKDDNDCKIGQVDTALLHAFQHRASHMAYKAYEARVVQKRGWTEMMVQLHRLAIAHSEMLLVANFYAALVDLVSNATSSSSINNSSSPQLQSPSLPPSTVTVLRNLYRLFAFSTLSQSATEFLTCGSISSPHYLESVLPSQIQRLMSRSIRPHAVRLVDAWSVPDYLLQSSLGRYDGDVYVDLFRKAHRENPLNEVTFNPNWRSEEVVLGEGEEQARRRIRLLALGVKAGSDAAEGAAKAKL